MTHTSTQQPEALRLADTLEEHSLNPLLSPLMELATELRRQHARITELEEQLLADTVRLNWLDAQVKNHAVSNGFLWRQECGWEIDRGLVCVIQDKKQKKTARQAIDAAIAAQAKQGGAS